MNINDEISRLAYEIWLKKGMPEGNALENWLEAERIVYASLREKGQTTETVIESAEMEVTNLTVMPEAQNKTASEVSEEEKPKKGRRGRKPSANTAAKTKAKKTTTRKKKA